MKEFRQNVLPTLLSWCILASAFFFGNTYQILDVLYSVYYIVCSLLIIVVSIILSITCVIVLEKREELSGEVIDSFSKAYNSQTPIAIMLFFTGATLHLSTFIYLGWSVIAGFYFVGVVFWSIAVYLVLSKAKKELFWQKMVLDDEQSS